MTRDDVFRFSLTRVAKILGVLLAAWAVLTAAKSATESWLVPQRELLAFRYHYDSTRFRDSLAAASRDERLYRQIVYERCERTKGAGEFCLRPDRP